MNEVDKMIPKALKAAPLYLLKVGKEDIIQKEYDGYAASLGASIRTSGLIPALAFYTDVHKEKKGSKEARRYKLLQALAYILELDHEKEKALLNKVIAEVFGENASSFNNPNIPVLKAWTEKILNASIALKLALRNFSHSE